MRFFSLFCILILSCIPVESSSDELQDAVRATAIDVLLERAIVRGLVFNAVVLVGNRDGILYTASSGRLYDAPSARSVDDTTIYDIASLTKVFASTPAVMKLLDDGALSLMDPLPRWFPEFSGTTKDSVTILNLLTHTSGLNEISLPNAEPLKAAIEKASGTANGLPSGSSFRYADINFILLGELVRRVSGLPLDQYCSRNFYTPLGMSSTMFTPPASMLNATAPTLGGKTVNHGMVQDENARRLGGIAGHAGLFSSAKDLARFVRMILNAGVLDGKRVLSERVVEQMTAPYFFSNGRVVRGLGWDINSPYSAPRGTQASEMSFGHTGYSGSSVWIDPQADIFVIVLTTRLEYRNLKYFNRLRSDITTIATAIFGVAPGSYQQPATAPVH